MTKTYGLIIISKDKYQMEVSNFNNFFNGLLSAVEFVSLNEFAWAETLFYLRMQKILKKRMRKNAKKNLFI